MLCRKLGRTLPFALWLCLCLQLSVAQLARNAENSTCNRTPAGTTAAPQLGDNGYEVKVLSLSGEEIFRFRPGHTYSITLTNRYPAVSFINFYMTTVPESVSAMQEFGQAVGTFSHIPNPPITRHSPNCPGMVEGVLYNTPMRLYNVKLHWTAPRYLMECVEFRTTVEAYQGEYFKDQGMLRKRICPHESFLYETAPSSSVKLVSSMTAAERSANAHMPADQAQGMKNMADTVEKKPDIMMPRIRDCCACGHATYQMVFQGLWTRQNHPRDWPTADSSVHWSNIIGASHSRDYLMYYFGGRASTAVKAMCELGDVTPMEREFRDEARWNVLNVLKTSGIWGLSNLEDPRTALFSVNQTHHLMSMLTMVGPSTDWCTGVSALDLCESGCQWKKELTVDLYPWDAGTVQGNTYEPKHRNPEINQQPIKLIQPTWMTNQPFSTGKNDEVLPVARLTIKRVRPKLNWQCERMPMAGMLSPSNMEENQQNTASASPNSKRRTNGKTGKKRPLWQETPGVRGSDERGMGLIQPMMLKKILTRCQHSPWSDWSPCSVSCGGSGVRHSTRTLLVNMLPQKCRLFETKRTEVCLSKLRVCPFEKCAVSGWTSWSPCNATCSISGISETRRHFTFQQYSSECAHLAIPMSNFTSCTLPPSMCDPMMVCKEPPNAGLACFRSATKEHNSFYFNAKQDRCMPFHFKGCKGNHNKFDSKTACENFCLKGLSGLNKKEKARLAEQQMIAINLITSQNTDAGGQCEQPVESGRVCQPGEQSQVQQLSSLTMGGAEGQSSGLILWYFNKLMRQCMPFTFLGCAGNVNRFATEMDCMKDCKYLMIDVGESQDCRVSSWAAWQPCSRQCGGTRQRQRTILAAAKFGGESCPPLYERATCPSCCPYSPWSAWSACSSTCRDPESFIPPMRERSRRKLITNSSQRCNPLPLTERSICTAENLRACPRN